MDTLTDPDLFAGDPDAQTMLRFFKEQPEGYGKIGEALAYQFQVLAGKGREKNEEIEAILAQLQRRFSISTWTPDIIKRLQGSIKKIKPVVSIVRKVQEQQIAENVADFNRSRIPDAPIIILFQKIGIQLTTSSGVLPISSDVLYLRKMVEKHSVDEDRILSEAEKTLLLQYLEEVSTRLDNLLKLRNNIDEMLKEQMGSIEKTKDSTYDLLLTALRNLKKQTEFAAGKEGTGSTMSFVSTMTPDLTLVIPHIRACLSCTTKGCNNDTDLSFGDSNRFFIVSQVKEGGKSMSDELVLLAPVNGQPMFILDQLYGVKNSAILFAHVQVALEKARSLHPDNPLPVLLPQSVSGTMISESTLQHFLEDNFPEYVIEKKENAEVTIPEHVFGDGYYECFNSGAGRIQGNAMVTGCVIRKK
jgi:hypothetical protein